MGAARYSHTATLLLDGRVLVAGSWGVATVELYTPLTDTVTIRAAVFFIRLSLLVVQATSPAAPEAELFLTVPEEGSCLDNAPMRFRRGRYLFKGRVSECGSLDGQTATVTSSVGGSDTAVIR